MDNKERRVGTCSRGIRLPIIREGDDLSEMVTCAVLEAGEAEGFDSVNPYSLARRLQLEHFPG